MYKFFHVRKDGITFHGDNTLLGVKIYDGHIIGYMFSNSISEKWQNVRKDGEHVNGIEESAIIEFIQDNCSPTNFILI